MKTQEVKAIMKDKNIDPATMARELGIDISTYYRKMKKNAFSALDLLVFKRVLEMNDRDALDFLLS